MLKYINCPIIFIIFCDFRNFNKHSCTTTGKRRGSCLFTLNSKGSHNFSKILSPVNPSTLKAVWSGCKLENGIFIFRSCLQSSHISKTSEISLAGKVIGLPCLFHVAHMIVNNIKRWSFT